MACVTVEVITDPDAFSDLAGAWTALEMAGAKRISVFSSFDWVRTWWESFGDTWELCVVVARIDNRVLALAPLMSHREAKTGFRKVVRFIGHPDADYTDVLISPGPLNEEAVRTILRYLSSRGMILDFKEIPADSPTREIIESWIRDDGCATRTLLQSCAIRPVIDIAGSWETYFAQRSKSLRQDIRTKMRAAERAGGIRYRSLRDVKEIIEIYPVLQAIHVQRQRRSLFLRPGFDRFYSALAEHMKGSMRVDLLEIGGQVAAFAINFEYHGILGYLVVGIAPDLAWYSPGKLLLFHIIQEAFTTGRVSCIDLLRGDEPYKFSWATRTKSNWSFHLFSSTISLRGYLLIRSLRQFGKRIKDQTPLLRFIYNRFIRQ